MPEFYHELTTEKSFHILQDLKQKFSFTLVGGWAVFFYTKALKSKDIDIVVDFNELGELNKEFSVSKNDRLKKYEVKMGDVDIDIYVPFYSNLGIPVEEIMRYTKSIEGFTVPIPEILLLLKIYVARERRGSAKGRKDIIDAFSLLKIVDIDWKLFEKITRQYHVEELIKELKVILSQETNLPELDISNHHLARLKRTVLEKIQTIEQ